MAGTGAVRERPQQVIGRSTTGCPRQRRGRGVVPGLSVVIMALTLVGCSDSSAHRDDGLSIAQVNERMTALPHVASAAVAFETTTDGTTKHYSIAVELAAPDLGGSRRAVADLISEVLPLAWSVDGVRPDNGVVLRLHTAPQLAIGPIAEEAGWDNVGFPTNKVLLKKLSFQATFAADDLDEQLGPWPLQTVESARPSTRSGSAGGRR